MNQYYLDTSVLLVYTLASESETARYPAVQEVFRLIDQEVITATTSFYALHEVYLFAGGWPIMQGQQTYDYIQTAD